MKLLRLAIVITFAALAADTVVANDATRRVPITKAELIDSPMARERLKYLTACALEEGTEPYGIFEEQTYVFPGEMGLAPAWADRALSFSEERWVSACLLARTNAFGQPVRISMRADGPFSNLTVSAREKENFPVHEAGFFGNLFSNPPRAFVCLKPSANKRRAIQEAYNRVCAHVHEPGSTMTRCGFEVIGFCPESGAIKADGGTWPEIIHVHLPNL